MSDDNHEEELETYVSGFVKFSLCFFNFLMWIYGLFLIAIGIWATIEEQRYSKQIKADWMYIDISIGLILVGIFIFLIPMLGFLGAIRENVILLRIFSVTVAIIVILEVLLTILVFVFWNQIAVYIEKQLLAAVVQYQDNLDYQFLLDSLQELFDCCGVSAAGYRDWNSNPYFNCSLTNPSFSRCGVPYSCCKERVRVTDSFENYMCGFGAQNDTVLTAGSRIYTQGCISATVDTLKRYPYAIGGLLIAMALCQVASFAMSEYMISRIKRFCKDCGGSN